MSGYQVVSTIEELERAGASDELFALIRGSQEVAEAMVNAGSVFLQNRYVDEEVVSNYSYPDGYSAKPLTKQIGTLAELFGLDGEKALAFAENLPELPEGAEGWFAIPKWQAVASTYGEAVENMFALIGGGRGFKNWREGKLGKQYLRQSERAEQVFARLCEQQDGDILIIPAQFSLRHRGRSVRRARAVFTESEFGLGSFAVGCMLLTHPEREQVWEQLHIDCSGDEYAPAGDGKFVSAPFFDWGDGKLRFSTGWTGNADKQYGSASGFAPQS